MIFQNIKRGHGDNDQRNRNARLTPISEYPPKKNESNRYKSTEERQAMAVMAIVDQTMPILINQARTIVFP